MCGGILFGPHALCGLRIWNSLGTSAFLSAPSDIGHGGSVEVLDEVEATGDQSNWDWKCSARLSILRNKLVTDVPSTSLIISLAPDFCSSVARMS